MVEWSERVKVERSERVKVVWSWRLDVQGLSSELHD